MPRGEITNIPRSEFACYDFLPGVNKLVREHRRECSGRLIYVPAYARQL